MDNKIKNSYLLGILYSGEFGNYLNKTEICTSEISLFNFIIKTLSDENIKHSFEDRGFRVVIVIDDVEDIKRFLNKNNINYMDAVYHKIPKSIKDGDYEDKLSFILAILEMNAFFSRDKITKERKIELLLDSEEIFSFIEKEFLFDIDYEKGETETFNTKERVFGFKKIDTEKILEKLSLCEYFNFSKFNND